jgi:hypothetical protein
MWSGRLVNEWRVVYGFIYGSFFPSFTLAMIVRVLDAYMQGDIWLAFSRRSNVGWPAAQILALIALASLIYLCYFARTRTKEKKISI